MQSHKYFNVIVYQNRKINPKNPYGSTNSHSCCEQKDQSGVIIISDFKLYYRGIVTKTAWQAQNRHVHQWNRRSRNNPTQQ
jgi:hypothetical protein